TDGAWRRVTSGVRGMVGAGGNGPHGDPPGQAASNANLPPGRRSCRRCVRQAEPDGHGRSLDAAGDAQLGEDIADVDPDRLLADEQALADLPVRPALGD